MTNTLNKRSQLNIYNKTGMTVEQIINMDFDEIDNAIEKKIGKKIVSKNLKDERLIGRGQPYIYLKRLLGISYIEKKLKRIK